MKFAEIQDDVYARAAVLPASGSPATAVTARLNRFINQTHRALLADKALSVLRRHVLTCTCVANSPYMVTPQAMTRLLILADRTNNRILTPMRLQDLRRVDPGLRSTTSTPDQFAVENYASTIALDPTAACQPFVVSDNAGDGATKKVFIEGTVTGGYYQMASVAMNGITPAAISGLLTWVTFTKFYYQNTDGTRASAVGNVTLTQGSGGIELSRIPPGRSYPRYTRLALWPVPSAANTYYADGDLHVEDMANADDEPMLPEDHHWLIISGAMMQEFKFKNRLDLYAAEKAEFTAGVATLKHWLSTVPGIAYSNRTPNRFSQLGPDFPAGT